MFFVVVFVFLGICAHASEVAFDAAASAHEQQHMPLVGARGYYLPLHNDDCLLLETAQNFDMSPVCILFISFYPCCRLIWFLFDAHFLSLLLQEYTLPANHKSIQQVLSSYQRQRKPQDYPPLVGRVIKKSRLIHYGTPNDAHKFPFQFYFTLGMKHG